VENARPEQRALLLTRFASFRAETPSGRVEFQGAGEEMASAAWQRAIAAWAQLVAQELKFGRSGASWGTALSWHRELPDQPEFCEFLQVERYGYAFASVAGCDGGNVENLGEGWLTDQELEAFDRWLYGSSGLDLSDLQFSGLGSQPMPDVEVNSLRDWAIALDTRLTEPVSITAGSPTPCVLQPGQFPCSTSVEVVSPRGVTQTVAFGFLLYLPPDYGADPAKEWPVILFLHGSEERGNDPRLLKRQGLPKLLASGTDLPFVVLSPQCPSGQWWWPKTALLDALLDHTERTYAVDSQRIYVTGLSMGGFGAWAMAYEHPDRFAAVVPIAGGYYDGTPNLPQDLCRMKDLPIWAFHGTKDTMVSVKESQRVVDALQACGSSVRFTLYPDAGHTESWERAYADPELYDWLLQQVRP
jgi:pimeloyl-ACP methyl ester carboxylesterase